MPLELQSIAYVVLKDSFIPDPESEADYMLNTSTVNIVNRMMRDKFILDRVSKLQNQNLKYKIQDLAEFNINDLRKRINTEISDYKPTFSTGFNAVNKLYADKEFYDEVYKEVNSAEKLERLKKNKSIIEMCDVFLAHDLCTESNDEDYQYRDDIVEAVCIESNTIEKIPAIIIKWYCVSIPRIHSIKNENKNLISISSLLFFKFSILFMISMTNPKLIQDSITYILVKTASLINP